MPTDPYDDLFKNLAKAIEDLFSNLSQDEPARIIGCTIISGSDDSSIFDDEEESDISESVLDYEVIEGPEAVYITAEIPPLSDNQPVVNIMPRSVHISVDKAEVEVKLPAEVQTDGCHTVIQNGILDIVCRKADVRNNTEE